MWNAADQLFNSFPRVKSSGAIYTRFTIQKLRQGNLSGNPPVFQNPRPFFRFSAIFLDREL
jgi:hypothetical protein